MVLTRVPFGLFVAGLVPAAAVLASWIKPGRVDILVGTALGTAVSGGFAALAVSVLAKVRREGGEKVGNRLITAFAGLMLARMLGYVALLMAAVFMGMGEPVSVCIGLVGGTLVFQPLEILYFKQSH